METASAKDPKRWLSLLFIGISLLVISLDNTILNVALPSISRELEASASELQWIVDAYILVFAALLLTTGSIGDRIGRKRILQIGLVWFGVGSLAAALSTSTEILIFSRAFLGVGGAIIMPATLSIITATFRDTRERSQAIALWAAIFGLGVGLGPVIGGWLLETYSWNAVFLVNIPIILVAVIGGQFYIRESKDQHPQAPDIPGVLLSISGLFALLYAIIEAGVAGWTAEHVVVAFVVAAVLLSIFAWWENRAPNAMLPLHFFRNMSFTGANTALALVTFSLFGALFFLSQYFQSVQGYTAFEAGIRLLPQALFLMFAASMSARVSARIGIKYAVSMGIIIAAVGLFYLSQVATIDASYPSLLLGLFILAMGMGTAMSPATDSVMGSVPVNKAGVASAMNDTTRQLGGALGVAVLGTIMNNTYLEQIHALYDNPIVTMAMNNAPAEQVELMKQGIERSIQGAHIVADMMVTSAPQGTQVLAQNVANIVTETANQAFVTGMLEAMFIGSVIMAIAGIISLIILPSEIRRPEESAIQQPIEPVLATGD